VFNSGIGLLWGTAIVADVKNHSAPSVAGILSATWGELGAVGRGLLAASALVVVASILLAQTVPTLVERVIIDGETQGLSDVAERIAQAGILPEGPAEGSEIVELDEFSRLNLLGHDTIRIAVWARDGTVLYSSEHSLIGRRFSEPAVSSTFSGTAVASRPDLLALESQSEGGIGPAWELYVPIPGPDGEVRAVLETVHLSAPVEEMVGSVRRYVTWSSIVGVALLAAVVVSIMMSQGRRALRQQQRAESMFGELVRARADERTRIVGALHDDIGQRLYRIHYGLQDLASRTDGGVAADVHAVNDLVLAVDGSLRRELRTLRHGVAEELRLDTALHELVELTEAESGLSIDVDIDPACAGDGTGRIALFRAAREAIVNVRKHAEATNVRVEVRKSPRHVVVTVSDDGVGSSGDEGVGLAVARERLEILGGGLGVKASHGRGTRVKAWLPTGVCEDHE
jgi:signal transduction histidine kinase